MTTHYLFGDAAAALAATVDNNTGEHYQFGVLALGVGAQLDHNTAVLPLVQQQAADNTGAIGSLIGQVQNLDNKYQALSDEFKEFRRAVYDTGIINDDNESYLPPQRVGMLFRLLDQVFSPYTETFFMQRPINYEAPIYTGGPGINYTGTITQPRDLFDEDFDGSFEFDFGASSTMEWQFPRPAWIQLSYQRVPTTDPDAPLDVEYQVDDGNWKSMEISSNESYGTIRNYGTFFRLRRFGGGAPPRPRLRVLRNVFLGALVRSFVTFSVINAGKHIPGWVVPPEEEEEEPEDPEPMAKRIRLADAAIKLEYYDKEE